MVEATKPLSWLETLSAAESWDDFKREVLIVAKAHPELWDPIGDLAEEKFNGGRKAVLRIQQAARLDFANKLEALDLAKAAPKLQPELETAPRPKPKPRLGILPLSAKPKLKIVGPPTKIEAAPRVFGKANFAEEKQKALEAIKANRNAEQQEDKSEEPQAPIAPVVWEPAKLATSP